MTTSVTFMCCHAALIGSVLFELFWTLPPIAIGIAVLRYRLYEIDRLISRTVTYAVISPVLVAVYSLVAVLPARC